MNALDVTADRFLGGRIKAAQPRNGFRAGHDTVLLAASVPVQARGNFIELGSGAGIASLCLAARITDANILGIEIDPELVRLSNDNAALNAFASRVRFIAGDADCVVPDGRADHMFFNPPFHPDTGQISPNGARDRATRDRGGMIGRWTDLALQAVREGGTVTAILRADRQDEILAAARGHHVVVFPLFAHEGNAPKRVIVQIGKGGSAGVDLAAGLVLHDAEGRNTIEAEAVLRNAMALELT